LPVQRGVCFFTGAILKKSIVLLSIAVGFSTATVLLARGKDDVPIYTPPEAPAAVPAAPASQPAVDPNLVIASVADEKITVGDFDQLLASLPPQAQQQIAEHPEGKKRLVDELINLKILSDEARRRKLDQQPSVRLRDQQVLAEALSQSLSDEAADKKFFEDNKDYFSDVNARHILIATGDSSVPTTTKLTDAAALAKAQQIKARLDKGEDFASIAKAESDDTSSGAQGGDLGAVSRGKMVKPFEDAVFTLKKNQISDPVRTQFGYHIIQVTSDKTAPAFDDVKSRVEQRRFEVLVEELKKQAKPEYNEAYFSGKPATTQLGAAPPTTQK
jgi:peptidyl-prolyl cis-trans isomerase C